MIKIFLIILSIMPLLMAKNNSLDGEKLYDQCAKCHGIRGEVRYDSIVQFIAGWDKDYLVEVLNEYKNGTRNIHRRGAIMSQSVQHLNNEQVALLSEYVSMLRPIVPFDGGTMGGNIKYGHKEYIISCKKCHGGSLRKAGMHTGAEWWKLFKNNGQLIAEKHYEVEAEGYFKSENFKVKYRDLYEFLHIYSSDSPHLPSPTV